MEQYSQAEKFASPEAELSFLREQVSRKEQELRERHVPVETETVIREQISKYRDAVPTDVLEETYALAAHDRDALVLNLAPERHDGKMQELIQLMEGKGIKNALSVLADLRDPHLEDDFHRFLVQYVKHGYQPKGFDPSEREFLGVGMTLYEVVLPENAPGAQNKGLREMISGMEQFLAGMMSVADAKKSADYITLEIANENGSDQFIFYAAVPDNYADLFEKQIVSIFNGVRLTALPSDYNIFNSEGVSLGSYLSVRSSPLYPFKTYDAFDTDPMSVILNSFSKIQKDGEGAAIQIVFKPQGEYFHERYTHAISQIEAGVPTKEAIDIPETFGGGIRKSLSTIFFKKTPKEGETKPVDSEALAKIKRKIASPIVATNVRVVVSAKSRPDAERILGGIESSFNQFADTTSNAPMWKRVEKTTASKLFRDFSFRSYNPSQLLPLNIRELTSLIHFHTTALGPTPQLKQSQAVSAPAPSDLPSAGTLLGVNSYRNVDTEVRMSDEDRLRHFYTIGQTGTGKSTLLKNMIIQDINAGHGVCMIDPHGIDLLDVLSNIPKDRYEDVIYFDPSYTERPMALNMLEYDRNYPEQKTFVVNELFSIFQKLYGAVPESMGPMFEQYFRNATMLVIEDPDTGCTLLDVSRVMSNKAFRDLKLSHCKNPVVVQFWTEVAEKAGGEAALANIVPYITSKFDVFLANDIMRPIIAQEKSSFNFRDIMDNKKILLVNLSKGRLGDINANLIGLILVGKILMAALSRADASALPPFYLYIDEFQNITTNSIATILSEARKYKLSLNIAHQFIAQLDPAIRDAVFGNVGSLAAFRVGADDATYLEKQFAPVFTAQDIMNIDNRNAYLKMLVNGRPAKAFNIKTLPPPAGNPSIIPALRELSYLTFGGDRAAIEAKILSQYQKK